MDIAAILIQIIGGASGGNLGGVLRQATSMGAPMNSILGAAGGVIGAQALNGYNLLANLGLGGDAIISTTCGLFLTVLFGIFRR